VGEAVFDLLFFAPRGILLAERSPDKKVWDDDCHAPQSVRSNTPCTAPLSEPVSEKTRRKMNGFDFVVIEACSTIAAYLYCHSSRLCSHPTKRHWFSGKIQRCHRWAPGSIPGWRMPSLRQVFYAQPIGWVTVAPFSSLNFFFNYSSKEKQS
jgi:hypothetical protein